MNPSDLGDELRRIAEELPLALADAEAATLSEALRLAQEFSDGDLTPADLRKLDHPYARRHGTALRDPYQVNEQSGEFQRGWQTEGPTAKGSGLVSALFNEDEKADLYLESGTDLMVPRQPHEKVAGRIEESRERRLERAIERTIGG